MKALLLLTIALFPLLSFGQRGHLQTADNYYAAKKYHEAISEYKMALNEDFVVNKFYVTQQIAKTYLHLFDYENAAAAYKDLTSMTEENSAENIYEYGQILRNLGEYDEAKLVFEKYIEKSGRADLKDELMEQCDWPKTAGKGAYSFTMAKTNIETGSRSFGASFYDGGLLYAGPQKSDFDIHTVYYDLVKGASSDSVNFDAPVELSKNINHLYYEGTPSLSPDGKTLYYTANASEAKKIKKGKKSDHELRADGLNVLKIYVSHLKNGEWSVPNSLNINSSEYNTAFPHISEDGKYLLFSSDRPGGMGLMDIYISKKINDSTWTEPTNLGPEVNSFENDLYPYLHENQLFFSSKGHEGFGGSDLFVATLNGEKAENRNNLGAEINSNKDDFALILKDSKGYLSSNRDGTHGYDHIYYVKMHPPKGDLAMDTLRGEIVDEASKQPIEGVLVKLLEEQEDGSFKEVERMLTGDDGKWEFVVRPDRNYQVVFEHDDYEGKTVDIPINDGKSPSNRDKILSQLNPLAIKKKDDNKERLYGEIQNKITDEPEEGVLVELYEKKADGTYRLIDQMTTGDDGKWEFWVDKDKEYQVKFSKDQFDQNVVDIPKNDGKTPSNRSKILAKLNPYSMNPSGKKDDVVTINNLYFDFNQVSVQTKSMPILNNLYDYLKANPKTKIELSAHTDAVGSDDYNMKLSQKRANFCKTYLLNKGISGSRIKAKGYGETKILNGCYNWNDCSEEENEVNRRVEVKFL